MYKDFHSTEFLMIFPIFHYHQSKNVHVGDIFSPHFGFNRRASLRVKMAGARNYGHLPLIVLAIMFLHNSTPMEFPLSCENSLYNYTQLMQKRLHHTYCEPYVEGYLGYKKSYIKFKVKTYFQRLKITDSQLIPNVLRFFMPIFTEIIYFS